VPAICDEILLTREQIAQRVAELGAALTADFAGEELRLVTVLKGGLFFLSDLCRHIDAPVTLDFLAVAQYVPGEGGAVRMTKDLDDAIEGARVILVEDVVDTGLTVNYVLSFLKSHSPASVTLCSLFDKPAHRIVPVDIDYTGFEMPDRFLVGYGLDVGGLYRNLPFVSALRPEAAQG
jgi:hypoxanthine phosphoribosyltransferase